MTEAKFMNFLLSAKLLIIAGCGALAPLEFPLPASDWRMVSTSELDSNKCSELEGKYSMLAEQIEYIGGEWVTRTPNYLAFYSSVVGPAQAMGIPIKSRNRNYNKASTDKWFKIRINSSGDINLDYFLSDEKLHSLQFDSENGQFSCEKGVLNFAKVVDVSGGEGVQANSQRLRSMGLNVNGDLVVYDWTSRARLSMDEPTPTFAVFKFARER